MGELTFAEEPKKPEQNTDEETVTFIYITYSYTCVTCQCTGVGCIGQGKSPK